MGSDRRRLPGSVGRVSQQWDPAPDSAEIDAATTRLLVTARTLSDADVLAPSALPGWTRGHVLSHIARNADSLVNRLVSAATGVDIPQYPSPAARAAGIEAGATRPIDEQVVDIEASHRRFTDAVEAVPPANWATALTSGTQASNVLEARLREVAFHHLDLDAGYSASDWPPPFAWRLLVSAVPGLERRGMAAVTLVADDLDGVPGVDGVVLVNGGSELEAHADAYLLATWLLGRSSSAGIEWTGGPELPTPPPW
jgi:maleylpyruvate isomerase